MNESYKNFRDEKRIWETIWYCFDNQPLEKGLGMRGCKEGGIHIFDICEKAPCRDDGNLFSILKSLEEKGLIEFMVSPNYVWIREGVTKEMNEGMIE